MATKLNSNSMFLTPDANPATAGVSGYNYLTGLAKPAGGGTANAGGYPYSPDPRVEGTGPPLGTDLTSMTTVKNQNQVSLAGDNGLLSGGTQAPAQGAQQNLAGAQFGGQSGAAPTNASQMASLAPNSAAWLQAQSGLKAQGQNEALVGATQNIMGVDASGKVTSPIFTDAYWADRARESEAQIRGQAAGQKRNIQDQMRRGLNPLEGQRMLDDLDATTRQQIDAANAATQTERANAVEQGTLSRANIESGLARSQPYSEQNWTALENYLRGAGYSADEMAMAKQAFGMSMSGGMSGGRMPNFGGGGGAAPGADPTAFAPLSPGNSNSGGGPGLGGTRRAAPAGGSGAAPVLTGGASDAYGQPLGDNLGFPGISAPAGNANPGGQYMSDDGMYIIDPNTGTYINPNDPNDWGYLDDAA